MFQELIYVKDIKTIFKPIKILGEGGQGKTYLAVYKSTNQQVVLKKIEKGH